MLLGPFDCAQRDDDRPMIEVNLLGAITSTEVFLDQIKSGGDIINISSVAGRTVRSGNGVYAAGHAGRTRCRGHRAAHPHHPRRHETGVQQLYDHAEVAAEDVAEIIAFILTRPRRLAINEILLRPDGQQ